MRVKGLKSACEWTEESSMSAASSSDGTGVMLSVEDGQVIVAGRGAPAQLAWGDHVRVLRNGLEVAGRSCAVMAGDQLHVHVEQQDGGVRYCVDVPERRLRASLRIELRPHLRRTLADTAPATRLELVVDEVDTGEAVPSHEAAIATLSREGVSFGIDEDAVAQAVAWPGSEAVVAAGVAPVPPTDASIQLLVDLATARVSGVPAGTLLARRIPPQPGKPGTDVSGARIEPEEPGDASVNVGDGARCSDDGLLVFAAIDGWPVLDGDVVSVLAERIVADLDRTTGGLDVWGNLIVTGSIEGIDVSASGRVTVQGNVVRAGLSSGRAMEVRGACMSSTLHAGLAPEPLHEPLQVLRQLPARLERLARHVDELLAAAAGREQDLPVAIALRLVMNEVDPEAANIMLESSSLLLHAGPGYSLLADEVICMHQRLTTAVPGEFERWHLDVERSRLEALVARIGRLVEEPATMQVAGTQASELTAAGHVTVVGTGMFSTHVLAHGGFTATSAKTVIRGCTIESDGHVSVAELGSPRGASTSIELRETGTLSALHVHGGTTIRRGGESYWFREERTHVKVGDGSDGMKVESLAA